MSDTMLANGISESEKARLRQRVHDALNGGLKREILPNTGYPFEQESEEASLEHYAEALKSPVLQKFLNS